MNFEKPFQALGQLIRREWRNHDFNELDFPAIAARAASDCELDFKFAAGAIADFLVRTDIRQQVSNKFSNLPITVYRSEGFHIELLIWTQSTTEIHQHGFSGAFRLLQGSSLHTRHAFRPGETFSLNLISGQLETLGSEQLSSGDIRQIQPGSDGLIHSLYHLDTPSVTMVIRTPGLPAYQPQYSYFPPCLCVDSGFFAKDSTVQMMQRLLSVAAQIDPERVREIWFEKIINLDFPRLAWISIHHPDAMEDDELRARIREHPAFSDGDRAISLFQVVDERKRLKDLINARAVISDPELRLFLALLMNIREKRILLEHLQTRYPDEDPTEKIAELLARLSRGKTETARMFADLASRANLSAFHLGRRLESAIPNEITSDPDRIRLFRQLLEQPGGNVMPESLMKAFPGVPRDAMQGFVERIRGLPHLSALLEKSAS